MDRGTICLNVRTVSSTDIPAANRFPIGFKIQDCDYACVEVADSGCGISPQDIENIFDPFFSNKFVGRGLGLAVVLGIVIKHRGVVTVETKSGRGSKFRIFIPLSAEAVPRKPVPAPQAPVTPGDCTIMVVDDESIRFTETPLIEIVG